MIKKILLAQAIERIFLRKVDPARLYLVYICLIIGIGWLSMASYFYFVDNFSKSYGAFISGIGCLILSLAFCIWNFYTQRKILKDNPISRFILENYSLIIPVLGKCKAIIQKKGFKGKTLVFVSALSIIYLTVNLIKNHLKKS